MDFTFHCAEIIFGRGKISQTGHVAGRFGPKAMICTRGAEMAQRGFLERMCDSLKKEKIDFYVFNLPANEPLVEEINLGAARARADKPDVIIALGGGSALDTGKAIAGLATNPGGISDYLEGVGRDLTLSIPALPLIAIPTTAGTGSEVTKNAVIAKKHEFKKSIRSPYLLPKIALLDPDLTVSLPSFTTAETGMDALTQLIESYISIKAQPIPQALAVHGIHLTGKYLSRAVENGADMEAREGMMLASLLSGLALANSGLGAAHGIAAALGAVCDIPHGRACAMLLPHVMRLNLPECRDAYLKIAPAFCELCDVPAQAPEHFIEKVECLSKRIGVPPVFFPNEVDEKQIPELIEKSRGSSMSGNPIQLTDSQIADLLRKLL